MTLESVTITTCCFQFMLQTLGNNEHSSNVNYTLLFKSIFPFSLVGFSLIAPVIAVAVAAVVAIAM